MWKDGGGGREGEKEIWGTERQVVRDRREGRELEEGER